MKKHYTQKYRVLPGGPMAEISKDLFRHLMTELGLVPFQILPGVPEAHISPEFKNALEDELPFLSSCANYDCRSVWNYGNPEKNFRRLDKTEYSRVLADHRVSHGLCPSCYEKTMKSLDKDLK